MSWDCCRPRTHAIFGFLVRFTSTYNDCLLLYELQVIYHLGTVISAFGGREILGYDLLCRHKLLAQLLHVPSFADVSAGTIL